jgi:hypothetical protein
MNRKVKIIKRGDRKEPELDRNPPQGPSSPTREISTTIKLWVSEFKARRHTTNVSSRFTG